MFTPGRVGNTQIMVPSASCWHSNAEIVFHFQFFTVLRYLCGSRAVPCRGERSDIELPVHLPVHAFASVFLPIACRLSNLDTDSLLAKLNDSKKRGTTLYSIAMENGAGNLK